MSNWTAGQDYPFWMNEDSIHTLKGGYLLEGETPRQLYVRLAKAAAKGVPTQRHKNLEEIFFDLMWKNWLCPASPVLSNLGTTRALPVSCYGVSPDDSLDSIFDKVKEAGMMSKNGGGVGIGLHNLRPRGALVNQNGVSDGVIPWCKMYEAASAAKQGGVRKGAFSVNLPIEHPDFRDFLQLKNVEGDPYQRTPKLHICAMISDNFMNRVLAGDPEARSLWQDLIFTRWKRGEPYIVFTDTANRANPEGYKKLGLSVKQTNICFAGDQRLLTSAGYRTMRELWEEAGRPDFAENDSIRVPTIEVINRKGVVKATSVYRTSQLAEVFKILTRSGTIIRATKDHKFIVRVPGKETVSGKRIYTEVVKPLKDLIPGELLVRAKFAEDTQRFGGLHDPEYALLAGLIIGDGSLSTIRTTGKVRAHLRLWNSDIEDCAVEVTAAVKSLYQKHHKVSGVAPSGKVEGKVKVGFGYRRADVGSMVLGRLMSEDGNVPGNKHRVPNSIWGSDKATICAFLRGLFTADGTVNTRVGHSPNIGIRIGQKNLGLLVEVKTLLTQLLIPARLYRFRKRGGGTRLMNDGKGGMKDYKASDFHELVISGWQSCRKFMDLVGFMQPSQNLKAEEWLGAHTGSRNTNHLTDHDEVVSIELDGEEEVFCLTEPESNEVVVNGLAVSQCAEIVLASDPDHSFVCVLSSLNLTKFNEWKDWSVTGRCQSDLPYYGILFLEGVTSAFIEQGSKIPAMENAVRFTEKSRAVGLGVLGYHALLQQSDAPWDSLLASLLNRSAFSIIKEGAEAASRDLAEELGEPEWCKGTGFRHTHRTAVAPTFSNSIISSVDTQGIEPLLTNRGSIGSAKGGISRRNPRLEKLLREEYGRNSEVTWNEILANDGSVSSLPFLSREHKEVYKTAFEIDQRELIKSAAQRQPYIDQAQSLNVFFAHDAHPKYVNETHIKAYELGVKTLYYFRSSAPLKADAASRSSSTPTTAEYPQESEECKACEG